MSADVRSHGRLYVFADPLYPSDTVLYDPYSKTLFLFNVRYYGWVKSLALACAGDILEDEHGIFSLHGACIDIDGRGLCLAGTSGAGKTTQTYGLLTDPHSRIIADDWFFARVFSPDILAYSSEKNFYIRQDLETIWKDFSGLKRAEEYDADGRAVADIRWVVGKGRIFPLTTVRTVIVLKRDSSDTEIVRKMDAGSGKELFATNSYYNPHLLVRDTRKTALRDRFIAALLERTNLYSVNTTGTPAETQERIRTIAGIAPGKK
jgi:serine kinase of HPr protein (carbohydrate metabolism regulator)